MIGALLGGLASVGGKLIGKATKHITKQIVGSGGKKAAVGAAVGTMLAPVVTNLPVLQGSQGFGPDLNPFGTNNRTGATFGFGGKKRIRRVNYTNMRALKKSIRRVQGAERLFREVFSIGRNGVTIKKARRK